MIFKSDDNIICLAKKKKKKKKKELGQSGYIPPILTSKKTTGFSGFFPVFAAEAVCAGVCCVAACCAGTCCAGACCAVPADCAGLDISVASAAFLLLKQPMMNQTDADAMSALEYNSYS